MPKFGNSSQKRLATCHPKLQEIMNEVIRYVDITIISGHRGEVEQNALVDEGYSKLKFPKSKHNSVPSNAIDVMLWNKDAPHIRWKDEKQMQFVCGYIKAAADRLGIKIRQGADWNGDMKFDESFYDAPHVEIRD